MSAAAPRSTALAILAACLLGPAATCAELRVPKDFPTIQAAVSAAEPGDEIVIAPGVYPEAVVIKGMTGLTLRGAGATIDPGGGALALTLMASHDIVIEGLEFRNSPDWPLIDCLGGTGLVFRRLRFMAGNYAVYAGGVQGLVLERSRFQDLTGPALVFEGGSDLVLSRSRMLRVWGVVDGSGGGSVHIERVVASQVANQAIDIGWFQPTHDVTIERTVLTDIDDYGIEVLGDRARIDRVRILRGADGGLSILGDDAVVDRLTLAQLDDHGALGISGDDMRVSRVLVNSCGDGADVRGTGGDLRDVKVIRPENAGLTFDGFSTGLAEDCLVVQPGEEGVLVEDGENSVFRRLQVRGAAPGNEEAAFQLKGTGHVFERNVSTGSGASAFLVEGEMLMLIENKALGAREHGFMIETGGNLLQRNRASGSRLFDLYDEQRQGANAYEDNIFGSTSFGTGS